MHGGLILLGIDGMHLNSCSVLYGVDAFSGHNDKLIVLISIVTQSINCFNHFYLFQSDICHCHYGGSGNWFAVCTPLSDSYVICPANYRIPGIKLNAHGAIGMDDGVQLSGINSKSSQDVMQCFLHSVVQSRSSGPDHEPLPAQAIFAAIFECPGSVISSDDDGVEDG